jgi:two-component system sensor histidine kinase DctS
MRLPTTARTREDALLLGVAASAAAVAIASVRSAEPPRIGLWVATATALALALAALFALWLASHARRVVDETLFGEWDAARTLLSAIPDGLLVLDEGHVRSVNRRLCELLGFEREELLGTTAPLPFWPPEHRHEIEAWEALLEASGAHETELTFRRRDGSRLRVLVAGRTVAAGPGEAPRRLVTVRDVSANHRRERRLLELSSRDPETGLLNHAEFEERLGAAVRRALGGGENVALVLAELGLDGATGGGTLCRPEGLVAVEQLRSLARAGDELARTRENEIAWILPGADAHGGVGAVARARTALAGLGGVTLTVGICDLAAAGDALALYAFADRALCVARAQGAGGTAEYRPVVAGPSDRGQSGAA